MKRRHKNTKETQARIKKGHEHKREQKKGARIEGISRNKDIAARIYQRQKQTGLQEARLKTTQKDTGPFTVFARSDEAFDKQPAGTVDTMLKPENKAKLTAILTGHVVPGKVMSTDLKDGQKVKTVGGNEVTVKIDGGKVMVGGANVAKADIAASNGVIHVIDTVILP